MGAQRKKWRLKLLPTFDYVAATSMKDAYARMLKWQAGYTAGVSRVHQVVIEVDERDGRGWQRFEVCTFPKPEGGN